MQPFFDTFRAHISSDDVLVIAVSWGVDSMTLLDLVVRVHDKDKIIVAHFDHSLRWIESDQDRELVANICKNENIVFEYKKMDIAQLAKDEKMSIEAIARRERYIYLESVRNAYNAHYILTAHHRDDQIETAVFNLIRGSKLKWIHALSERNGHIFRPLIGMAKSDVLSYARLHKIRYREDVSNSDTTYLRNHIRHVLLPQCMKINPEYQSSLQDFIKYTKDLKDWIDTDIVLWLKENQSWEEKEGCFSFSVQEFEKKSPFFQKEVLRYIYEQGNNGTIGLSEWLIDEVLRYIITAEGRTEKWYWIIHITKQKSRALFSF